MNASPTFTFAHLSSLLDTRYRDGSGKEVNHTPTEAGWIVFGVGVVFASFGFGGYVIVKFGKLAVAGTFGAVLAIIGLFI